MAPYLSSAIIAGCSALAGAGISSLVSIYVASRANKAQITSTSLTIDEARRQAIWKEGGDVNEEIWKLYDKVKEERAQLEIERAAAIDKRDELVKRVDELEHLFKQMERDLQHERETASMAQTSALMAEEGRRQAVESLRQCNEKLKLATGGA